jgi:hypothetical protein
MAADLRTGGMNPAPVAPQSSNENRKNEDAIIPASASPSLTEGKVTVSRDNPLTRFAIFKRALLAL